MSTNPTTPPKNFMQNVEGRKKYLARTYPKKKNSWGMKGLKKKFMPIPNHPTSPPPPLQKLNGWPLSYSALKFLWCKAFWEGSYYNYNIVFNYYYALMMVKELDVSRGDG